MSEYSVKIIVATHKKYKMPSDAMYIPLYVGAEGKKDSDGNELDLGYIKDNTGENISNIESIILRINRFILGMEKFRF